MNSQWEKEVIAAAKWWADQLDSEVKHDNGDKEQSRLANFAASQLEPITEEQYCNFREALQNEIDAYLQERNNWRPDEPQRGHRWIGTDYHPCAVIQKAADAAGITQASLRFPIKTGMWIDPGEVRIARGYRAPIETIYKREE